MKKIYRGHNVETFLANQLDFIFFFYGLAFIFLGMTSFAISRGHDGQESWAVLGGFALVHGIGEWLDLAALIIGDAPPFALGRFFVIGGSFVLLMEFARLEGIRLGGKLPGRWIYVPLLLALGLAAMVGGLTLTGIVSRYLIGFVGALGSSLIFAHKARALSGTPKLFAVFTSLGFALYAVATGLVVPASTFWPASVANYATFSNLTGMPIQLVRGLLACGISLSVWGLWRQQLASDFSSTRYTEEVRQQFVRTLVTMAAILVSGWTLTEFLGDVYRQNVQAEARSDIDLLAGRLASDTAIVDGMVSVLAGSPSIRPLASIVRPRDKAAAEEVLRLNVEASGARRGYILDRTGSVIVSASGRGELRGARSYGDALYFRISMHGDAGHEFAFNPANGQREYYASQPVRTADGQVVGVAVLVKSLDSFAADLRRFDRPYFFVDPDGVVVMSNRPEALLRTLWPLAAVQQATFSRKFGRPPGTAMVKQEIADAMWTNVDGERNYVRRRFADHSQWSLVVLKPTREIFASRFLGIIITLLVTILALSVLLGRERRVHDEVQSDSRLKLLELAQDLAAARDEARAAAERLKMALHAGQAAAFEIDFAGRRFWASPELAGIYGRELTFDDISTRGAWAGLHPDDAKVFDALRGQWGKPGFEAVDVRTIAHGQPRWVRIYFGVSRDAAGVPTMGVGLLQDIDQRKRQELELVAAHAAAEAATEAKSNVLASVSHEIRTPMNGIVGVLHLLKSEPLSADARRLLDEALACSAMLGQLINDVLDLSKIEAGKVELSPEPTDPAGALESLLQLMRPQAEAKGLYLRAEVEGQLGWVETDPMRFRQCLFNLIGNAIKFTQTGGVAVRLSAVGDSRLRVEVADTGAGLAPAVQARLFQRFEQADVATTREHGGTGLGLAITKSLVGLMGGDIGVQSREGEGSVFWFEISAPACDAAVETATLDGPALSNLRILLVDDNATNRLIGGKILEALGASTSCSESGAEAVEAVRTGAFDLILMDINMPGMDGMEATRIIRALPGAAAVTPIIALTANVMAHQRTAYRAAGMEGVISKPFSPASLLAEIVRVMSPPDPERLLAAAS